ncbi:MAG TPA: hypothetical protein VME01_04025 [Solirubrobacteraceae bacterium]|nr:hypothetical protein [Solirubrobacteraceae bacterium]
MTVTASTLTQMAARQHIDELQREAARQRRAKAAATPTAVTRPAPKLFAPALLALRAARHRAA